MPEVIGTEQTVRADPVLAEHYLQAAQEVSKRLARGRVDSNQLISSNPAYWSSQRRTRVRVELVSTALMLAADELELMRSQEGQPPARSRRASDESPGAARVAAQRRTVERLHARIEERITRVLQDRIEPGRLVQEAALLADKADVSEERRISSHCTQFAEALATNSPRVGSSTCSKS